MRRLSLALVGLGVSACGGDKGPTEVGPVVAVVQVTSPVDTILALGRSAQLTAVARDQAGSPVAAQFTWATSNAGVLTVSAAGLATAQGAGTASVTAMATGSVSGGLRLRVVQADLATVSVLASDPLAGALVTGLSAAKESAVQAALGGCGTGAGSGNVVSVRNCANLVRAEAASATDPTDRVLLAVLALYADQIERLLGL